MKKQISKPLSYNYFLWDMERLFKLYNPKLYTGKLLNLLALCRDGFFIKGNIGNNTFSYISGRTLSVAPVCEYLIDSKIELGTDTVFVDKWDDQLKVCCGLKKYFVGRTERSKTPFYLCDNHNFVLEAWQIVKDYSPKLTLVHIDQHRDDAKFSGNINNYLQETRICDYIDCAKKADWINLRHYSFTESKDLAKGIFLGEYSRFILNIDLDFFAPEVTHISLDNKIDLIQKILPYTELITIATSPGFIDQKLAILLAEILIKNL